MKGYGHFLNALLTEYGLDETDVRKLYQPWYTLIFDYENSRY